MRRIAYKNLPVGILFVVLLATTQCATKTAPAPELPKDILGVTVGMSKDEAQRRLKEIARFDRKENERQELWRLNDASRFSSLAVGYDSEDKVRFVAAISNDAGSNKMRYGDVGDLSRAQQDISEGNYRYVWDIPETEKLPAYQVVAHGNKPDYPMLLTLSKSGAANIDEEEEKERKER